MKRLNIQLNKQTNQNLIKVPKVVKQTNRKHYFKIFGTSVINSPLSPRSDILINISGAWSLFRVYIWNPAGCPPVCQDCQQHAGKRGRLCYLGMGQLKKFYHLLRPSKPLV